MDTECCCGNSDCTDFEDRMSAWGIPLEEVTTVTLVEEVLLHGPGRVKQGLLWLKGDKAKEFGLSLEQLIARAVKNENGLASDFRLDNAERCAIGYAGDWYSYGQVSQELGTDWLIEHGFLLGPLSREGAGDAYTALTDEWRTQLQALADEPTQDGVE